MNLDFAKKWDPPSNSTQKNRADLKKAYIFAKNLAILTSGIRRPVVVVINHDSLEFSWHTNVSNIIEIRIIFSNPNPLGKYAPIVLLITDIKKIASLKFSSLNTNWQYFVVKSRMWKRYLMLKFDQCCVEFFRLVPTVVRWVNEDFFRLEDVIGSRAAKYEK